MSHVRASRRFLILSLALLTLTLALVGGCRNPFSLMEMVNGPDGKPLTVRPSSGTLVANETIELVAEGGFPPYSFRIADGAGAVDGTRYTAPASAGEERLEVADAAGAAVEVVFTITAGDVGLAIAPMSHTLYTGQSVTFTTIGGTGPFSYSVSTNNSGAPAMSGATYTAGSTPGTDTITVTDGHDGSAVTATVVVQGKSFSLAPSAISVYVNQSVEFAAVGGDGPYTYALVSNGSGAPAMSASVYTAGSTPGTDTVRVTDTYDGRTRDAVITVLAAGVVTNVDYAPSEVTNVTGSVKTGSAFTATSSVTNNGTSDGSKDIVWTAYASVDTTIGGSDFIVADGTITGGLPATGSQAIAIGGTWPREPGDYYLLLQVAAADDLHPADNVAQSANPTHISEAVSLSPASQTVYTGGTATFSAVGGTGPFTFAVTSNNSGAPAMADTTYTAGSAAATDTITVTDTYDGGTATASVVVQAKPLSVSPATISVYVNQPVEFAAVGGDGPFSYALVSNGSGAPAMVGSTYTAGADPGTDTVQLTDTYDGRTAQAVVTVVDAPMVTNVDYQTTAVSGIAGGVQTGSTFSASSTITNVGTRGGTEDLSWTAYASLDTAIGGSDFIVDAGTIAGGLAASDLASVSISGSWPSIAGDYYVILHASAADDLTTGNNTGESAGATHVSEPVAISPVSQSVYTGGSVTFNAVGGTGPFSFAVTTNESGAPPMAGATYTAGVNAGTDTITVTDTYDGAVATTTVTVQAKALSISPATISVYANQTVDFDAVGGDGPFGYAVVTNGSGAPAVSGSSYTAGPNPGTDTVRLTDTYDGRTVDAVVTVVEAPLVSTVDYEAAAVTGIAGGVETSSLFSAESSVTNIGSGNGAEDVAWTAYASLDTAVGGSDVVVDSGLISGGIAAGGTSLLTIQGNWPAEPGDYYLLIFVDAPDDLATLNNVAASAATTHVREPISITPASTTVYTGQSVSFSATGDPPFTFAITTNNTGAGPMSGGTYVAGETPGTDTITVTDAAGATAAATVTVETAPLPTSVDYGVTTVTQSAGTTETGDPVSGTVDLTNAGTADGGYPVSWAVYASTDTTVSASDEIVASGSTPAMVAGGTTSVAFSGTWPDTAGDYYLVAEISAVDDTTLANNAGNNSTFTTVTAPVLDIEYRISSITTTAPTPDAGSTLSESFVLRNIRFDAGTASITWSAYLSEDELLSTTPNTLVDSGTTPALAGYDGAAGGADEATVSISGTWPQNTGTYYLIVRETADDEITPGEVFASAAVDVQAVSVDVDYRVSVVPAGGAKQQSSPISESFVIENQGTANGSARVYWNAYLSADATYSADDTFVDSGSISGGLTAGSNSGALAITGTWPATTGQVYLIVRLSATDDINTANDSAASASYYISAPGIVDYQVTEITMNHPTADAGSPIEEGFTITNLGEQSGTDTFDWNLYVSADAVLGGDSLVDSATGLAALDAGSSLNVGGVGASWPAVDGSYYLIVELGTADDDDTSNNVSVAGPYSIELPPDYTVSSASIPTLEATAGTLLSATGMFDFTIQNVGADGSAPVTWQVYASYSSGVDGHAVLLKSGVEPALAAGATGPTIDFSDAVWPSLGSYYYIVIAVGADDDENAGNDYYSSSSIAVPQIYTEGTENNDDLGPTATALTNVSDLGPTLDYESSWNTDIKPYQLVRVNGTSDASFTYDTYAMTIGTGVSSISTHAVWSSGTDHIDLYIWPENNWEASSLDLTADRESVPGAFGVTGWTAGQPAYVGVEFLDTATTSYTLYIQAHP